MVKVLTLVKNFISLPITLLLAISCNAFPTDEETVNAVIDAHLAFMREQHGMICTGRGMGSPHGKIENISIWLKQSGLHTIEQARALAVSGVEDLITKLNDIPNGKEILSQSPCTAKDIYYSISFIDEDKAGFVFKEPSQFISCVDISNGKTYYLTYRKKFTPPTTVHLESYEDGLKVLESPAHPENLLPE